VFRKLNHVEKSLIVIYTDVSDYKFIINDL